MFPQRSGRSEGYLFSPILFNIVVESPSSVIKGKKRNKKYTCWKEINKHSFFFYRKHDLLFVKLLSKYLKKILLELIDSVKSQNTRYIYISLYISIIFLYTGIKQLKIKIKQI